MITTTKEGLHMKKKLIVFIVWVLLITTCTIGVSVLIKYNTSNTAKAIAIAEEYNIPVTLINNRRVDGQSLEEIETQLSNGELIYYKGNLVMAEYKDW